MNFKQVQSHSTNKFYKHYIHCILKDFMFSTKEKSYRNWPIRQGVRVFLKCIFLRKDPVSPFKNNIFTHFLMGYLRKKLSEFF